MGLFRKRHKHTWEIVDKRLLTRRYKTNKGIEYSADCIGKLSQCKECGEKIAIIQEIGAYPFEKEYGETVDVDYYEMKFMEKKVE